MSGHSKWSQIKRQKGAADLKRGAIFSKLANQILLAAKKGGDANTNFALKMAIDKARAENMPKENIERAIQRGTGEISGALIDEILYEVIAPHGVGIIVNAATDNKNRTTANIKNILTKFGGKLASSGAVAYQFQKMGKIIIDSDDQDKEVLEFKIIDSGAEDFTEHDNEIIIYTKPNELEMIKKVLENQLIAIKDASLSYEPKNIIKLTASQADAVIKLIENIEALEEVNEVYTNFDLA